MYRLRLYGIFLLFTIGVFWVWQNTSARDVISQYIENGEIFTLEARYTPEQIMQTHTTELLGEHRQRTFRDAKLQFYPYTLMDVKYSLADRQTREGIILWGMVDGEMVLNTDTWEKTHGFEDALNARASHNDFRIMNTLAMNKGIMTIQQLQKALSLEGNTLNNWLEGARDKHLILIRGNDVQLHLQNPRISVIPHTKMNEWVVTKPYAEAKRFPRRYTLAQIEKTAYAAFGQNFTIRQSREVFLPVYTIEMVNPDGSILTSHWNAINGRRIGKQFGTL